MNDIFEMQDDISLAIVEALRMRLPGGEKATLLTRPTNDPEAYRHYLEVVTTGISGGPIPSGRASPTSNKQLTPIATMPLRTRG
jgi:hypothetical protein